MELAGQLAVVTGGSRGIGRAIAHALAAMQAHVIVNYAEQADVDTVLVAGKVRKRHGKLLFPEKKLQEIRARLAESRARLMKDYRISS